MRVEWLTANVHDVTFGCIEHHAPGTGPLFQSNQILLQHHLVFYAMYHSLDQCVIGKQTKGCSKVNN